MEIWLDTFLIKAQDRHEWSALCSSGFTLVERAPVIHGIEGWLEPRASLDMVAKNKNLYSSLRIKR